jgi:hypothetical protein
MARAALLVRVASASSLTGLPNHADTPNLGPTNPMPPDIARKTSPTPPRAVNPAPASAEGRSTPPAPKHALDRGGLPLDEASYYLGLEKGSRWLTQSDCPVPKCDIRKPGSSKPAWVWRRGDLDAFLERRVIQPGQPNPMDLQ